MKESLLIFGGGELQVSLIKKANELNYYTIVIDPDPKAIGKKYANLFFAIDGQDYQATLKLAKDFSVKGLVTSATDKPILMMSKIAEELNLQFPSYHSCRTLLDKSLFKIFLKENSLPHANGNTYSLNEKIDKDAINFPAIVKPVQNSGSRGVLKCDNRESLEGIVKETLQYSNNNKFLIEDFIDGDEISIEAIVHKKKVEIIQITDKVVSAPPFNVELGHSQPSKYARLKNEFMNILQKIVDKSELDNCAIHPEFKINQDKITIIEIGPRLGGDFITSHLVPLSTSVDMEKLTIDIATKKEIDFTIKNNASMISYFNFQPDKIVALVPSIDEIKKKFEHIVDFVFKLNAGDKSRHITNSLDRYGHFILGGNELSELKFNSIELNNYMLKSIFNNED